MVKFTPLEPPRGVGKDLPLESAADDNVQVEMVPEPILVDMPEVVYPYNKVTKYLNGHKTEFNTTEGSEYINLQHGDEKSRITLFKDGNVEVRQQGSFYHDVKTDKEPAKYTLVVDDELTIQSDKTRITSTRSFESKTEGTYRIEADEKFVLKTPEVEVIADSIIIDGDVEVRGNLTVRGDLRISGEVLSALENITRILEKLEKKSRFDEATQQLAENDISELISLLKEDVLESMA